ALGIKGIGLATARDICRTYPSLTLDTLSSITPDQLLKVEGVGESLMVNIREYMEDEKNIRMIERLCGILRVSAVEEARTDSRISGKTFVITGSLNTYENRSECKKKIESYGGKVASAVSANTDFLVNNDAASTSTKNKKARSLNIPIITEDELNEMFD
ncbi:MAG: NAD-dependent DNA ligase LigA, partial [Eubacterium sp.]|nr:NAD-dependent DNA ligase LigA [Eubacterium sp.]